MTKTSHWSAAMIALLLPIAAMAATGKLTAAYRPVPLDYASALDRDGKSTHERERVEIEGVSSLGSAALYPDRMKIFIQDGQVGLTLFGRKPGEEIQAGDRIRARGTIATFAGSPELMVDSFDILERKRPVQAATVPPEQLLSTRYAARLVTTTARVVNRLQRSRRLDVSLDADGELLYIHLTDRQKDLFRSIPFDPGSTLRITGIASPYRDGGGLRWQITPREPGDVVLLKNPPIFTRREVAITALIGFVVLVLGLVWIELLRLQVRRSTRKLQDAVDRLKLLGQTLESTRDLVSVTDEDERFTFVNKAFLEQYGYELDEILGKHPSILDSPRNSPEQRAEISSSAKAGEWRGELFNRRKDGSEFPISLTTSIIFDEHGNTVGLVGVANDISERRMVEQRLRDSETRYRLLFEKNPLPMWLYESSSRRIIAVNEAAVSRYGYSLEEYLSLTIDALTDDKQGSPIMSSPDFPNRIETVTHRLKDGTSIFVEVADHPLHLEERDVRLLVANDVTERKIAQEQIEFQAFHDALTGLPNRRLLMDRLTQQMAHARRTNSSLVVMFLDLDRFKRINDTLGHWTGDQLLRSVGPRLKGLLRESDTIARVGGDEFTIILGVSEPRPSVEATTTLAEKIQTAFALPFQIDKTELYVTASVGVAVYPSDGEDPDSILKSADRAMYRAKELGRNGFQLSRGAAEDETDMAGLSLEHDLHEAVGRNEFMLQYQPLVDIRTGKMRGVEALLRWNHPSRGLLHPKDFIAAAEESLLIVPIGEWVIRTACEQMKAWEDLGLDLFVSVNLSARQFQRGDLYETLRVAVESCRIEPSRLELEITERLAMQDVERTSDLLRRIKTLGVRVAMDDFGTGYSALGYLKYFPIDTVKIDQTFVRDITTDASDAAIVSAVIAMAHSLRMQVIAEGVENSEQLAFLTRNGCDMFQGFLFSAAVPATDIERFSGRVFDQSRPETASIR